MFFKEKNSGYEYKVFEQFAVGGSGELYVVAVVLKWMVHSIKDNRH